MVNSYVQNRRQPSLETLYKIAEILKVDVKDLIISKKYSHPNYNDHPDMKIKIIDTIGKL